MSRPVSAAFRVEEEEVRPSGVVGECGNSAPIQSMRVGPRQARRAMPNKNLVQLLGTTGTKSDADD